MHTTAIKPLFSQEDAHINECLNRVTIATQLAPTIFSSMKDTPNNILFPGVLHLNGLLQYINDFITLSTNEGVNKQKPFEFCKDGHM